MARLLLYDNLKALGIILVVMGHVCLYCLPGDDGYLGKIIYAFHMPLFFFVSGVFAIKSSVMGGVMTINSLIRRIMQLMVPFVVIGGLYCYVEGRSPVEMYTNKMLNYWFLPSLTYCFVMLFVAENLMKKDNITYLLGKMVVLWLIGYALSFVIPYLKSSHYYMSFLRSVPFFIMGICYRHVPAINKAIRSKWTVGICMVAFVLYILFGKDIFQIRWGGFLAIPVLIWCFNKFEQHISPKFTSIGRYTLEIYTIHYFLLPTAMMTPLFTYSDVFADSVIVEGIVSLLVSLPIIAICMLLGKLTRDNVITSKLLWGK